MATYSIPKDFIEGFDNIISLTDEELNALKILIKNLEIAESFDSILDKNKDKFPSLSALELQGVMRSLVSIVDIFEESNKDIEAFTNKFSKSYFLSKDGATEEKSEILKNRLSILLNDFKNLIITVKSQVLLTENQRNFRDCRVISDVRMLFDDDLELEKKHALIVHNLKIEYSENHESKGFFVALDLSDLKKIKDVIDRAIEKDKIIKSKNHIFSFIEI